MILDLLDEIKGFKCQITIKILLKNTMALKLIFFCPVYFNSIIKTEISFESDLDKFFQEFLYRFITELIKDLVGLLKRFIFNTLTFQPLDQYQGVFTLNYFKLL